MKYADKTDKELMDDYKNLHISVNKIDCFGSSDLLAMELIEQELYSRNIEIVDDSVLRTCLLWKDGKEIE